MGQSQVDHHLYFKGPKREEEENLFEEIMAEKLPNLDRETYILFESLR